MKNRFGGLSRIRVLETAAICLFALVTLGILFVRGGDRNEFLYCLATIPFACLPLIISVLFEWRLNLLFYSVFSFYTVGPLLGSAYSLYYLTNWWDDLLHALAGFIFAVLGVFLTRALNRGRETSWQLEALFGLCFSIAIAVIWEIYEFSSDIFLGSDMQADTILDTVRTRFGRMNGHVIAYEGITEVSIGGQPLGFGGYLDIGLFDTMQDMILETVGAAVYLIFAFIDRGAHPLITSARD